MDTIPAWKIGVKPNGKAVLTFHPPARPGCGWEFLHLPCGQCIECRLEYSRQWAMRCMHEASLHEANCFVTLTFNDEHLDPVRSLRKSVFVKFLKRLRRFLAQSEPAKRVRYYHAGEYGEQFGRPHHHVIFFGYDFPDRVFKVSRRGNNYYESALLSRLWSDPVTGESLGYHEITDVSFETCAYVARYVCKKITGARADEHYTVCDEQGNFYKRVSEYATMSRRPGIGRGWYEKYRDTDAYGHDRITVRGKFRCKPPRYYDGLYELDCPGDFARVKNKRKVFLNSADNEFDRQVVREKVKVAQVGFLKRSLV